MRRVKYARSHDKTSGSSRSSIRDVCLAPDERGRAWHVASHPARLVRLAARGKQQITGPWDEALPKLYLFKNTERASGVPRYRHWAANK